MDYNEPDMFFVGDGSAALMRGASSHAGGGEQLTQLFAISGKSSGFEIEQDLDRFSQKPVTKYDYESLLISTKKGAYGLFDFLGTKSKLFSVPVREEDLVITEEDRHIISYLAGKQLDINLYGAICEMLAYREMGITEVRYETNCGCPVCGVMKGRIFSVSQLMRNYSGGSYSTHCGEFGLSPVIYRETYEGPCEDIDWEELNLLGKVVRKLPKELASNLHDLIGELDPQVKVVEFVNMSKELEEVKDSEGVVVFYKDGLLKVHNSYVGNQGPIEFLAGWLAEEETGGVDVGDLAGCETFFWQGKKVAKYKGSYWDLCSGEKVK